jgi:hypothetical protein
LANPLVPVWTRGVAEFVAFRTTWPAAAYTQAAGIGGFVGSGFLFPLRGEADTRIFRIWLITGILSLSNFLINSGLGL